MTFKAIEITHCGVSFPIVLIPKSEFNNKFASDKAMRYYSRYFNSNDVILATQDIMGVFHYKGRRDIVDFLRTLHPSQIHWKRYTKENFYTY
ncbi:hypothetical protein EEL30_19810 [Brevibacillus laterosporus]|uniref:Uncharacterized protein n=1 Tax=Brevibacillus laterosporus TaxID=1465 RepID=A0A518VBI2_BRELA|nr:hypothetical protein EEL30_19810 [Brevibacillus laterosporus]